ncbi:response regulator [Fibrella sp. HMF5335]|uniref:Response regulator n=1 Tax=Fibrella rubiginis TaxID=2817060 RepID=A0A939GKA9_9BACT|nr:response regulator [Fibrella rubiginis]MBO0938370.1 response regulator [Fibrella rubiginis]
MNQNHKPLLLIADDDDDDRVLIEQALKQTAFNGRIHFVEDGEQLIQYLKDCQVESPDAPDRPTLLLVDLNMPVVNGVEALTYIKSVPGLRQLPVVMLTTSSAESDISTCYNLGASSFVIKPITFTKLVELMDSLRAYWLGTVQLPR